ncbi:MAG: tRNA glutamyl-Q(34) synthetase GluQRS, partial [Asticcacaulis sp.]
MVFRTRFAPSPTGFLHLGHAFSAMTAYEAAQAEGGDFLLRIEDIDHTRCRPLFEQAIFDDLAWLGIDWPRPVLRQSEHIGDYQAALERLRDMGVVHADARTRRSAAEAALSAPQEGSPSGDASMDTAATHAAWRLSLEEARRVLGARYDALSFTEGSIEQKAVPETNGDVVLGRKDIGVAYHLCVVIDDARQGISHVIRGRDLIDATHTQVLLQALLDLPTPQYRHHALL